MNRYYVPAPCTELRRSCRNILIVLTVITAIVGAIVILSVVRRKSSTVDKQNRNEIENRIYNECIIFIERNIFMMNATQKYLDYLQEIQRKVLVTLESLGPRYKRNLILYLYENQLIRADISMEKRLHIHRANLTYVQFQNLSLNYLYLPSVVAFNSLFSGCQLNNSNFQQSRMDDSHFIDCSLELATFSGSSLKRTSFINISGLSSIDFTNTDLLNSNINIDEFENKSHFIHARLPNQSFFNIDSNNLIKDGGTEEQCHNLQSKYWYQEQENVSLTTANRENNSCIEMRTIPENNCYFQMNSTSAFTQHIDLNRYSILIDNNLAWVNLSAYLGCTNNLTNQAFIEIYFSEESNNFENTFHCVISYGGTWTLFSYNASIPVGVRTVMVVIGAHIEEECCAIDDITLNIYSK